MGRKYLRRAGGNDYGVCPVICRSKPVNLNTAWSLGRQFFGENGIRAAMYLQALNRKYPVPGGNRLGGFSRRVRTHDLSLPKPTVDWQRKPGKISIAGPIGPF